MSRPHRNVNPPKKHPFRGAYRTAKEIAAMTGFSLTTVKSRLRYGRSLHAPYRQKVGDGAIVRSDGRRSTLEAHEKRKLNHRLRQRKAIGCELGDGEIAQNAPKAVTIDGKRFKSTAAAARHFAVSDCTLRRTRNRLGDTFTRKDLRNVGAPRNTCPGTFDGKEYPSIAECSRQTGISIHKLRRGIYVKSEKIYKNLHP